MQDIQKKRWTNTFFTKSY